MTNIGIENVGIDDSGNSAGDTVTIRLSFFDPTSGAAVGTQPAFALGPGQMMQINDVFNAGGKNPFQLPAGAESLIVFVDEVGGKDEPAARQLDRTEVLPDSRHPAADGQGRGEPRALR